MFISLFNYNGMLIRTCKYLVLIVVMQFLVSRLVQSQTTNGLLGMKVVTKQRTPLRVSGRVVDSDRHFRVYTVQNSNGDWLWLVHQGIAGWVKGDSVVLYDRAVDYFTQEIQTNPSTRAFINRGNLWLERQEFDIAIGDFTEAIKLDPSETVAFAARGTVWIKKKAYDKAIADLNEAVRLDPSEAGAFLNRGAAWSAKKIYDKAIADFTEAIKIDSRYTWAYNGRGVAWNEKKNFERALADYNEAIRIDPKYADPVTAAHGFGPRALM